MDLAALLDLVQLRPSGVDVRMAAPSQVFVPVRAAGATVLDNGGDVIAVCFTPALAARVASLLNADSGAEPWEF